MKTSELTGVALDWAVAKCEGAHSAAAAYLDDTYGLRYLDEAFWAMWEPSTNWAQGGPIIEREKIDCQVDEFNFGWRSAYMHFDGQEEEFQYGPTPLISAMRCLVAKKLGDNIEIPSDFS